MENNNTAGFVFDFDNLDKLGMESQADTSNIEIDEIELEDIVIKDNDTDDSKEAVKDLETVVDDSDNKSTEEVTETESTVAQPSDNSSLKEVLKGLGITSFVNVTEDGNEEEVNIDEVDLDTATALDLIKSSYEQEIEQLKANSISIENVDKDRQEIVDFIIKGGDPKKLIEYQNEIDSVRQYDLDDPEDAETVIRKYYSYKDVSKEEVDIIIAGARASDKLTAMAEDSAAKITQYVEKLKEAEKEHINTLIENQKKALKEYTKGFKEKVKEAGYTDKHYNKLVDFATKKVKKDLGNGQIVEGYEMDFALQAMRANPAEATELAMFVLDREAYLKKLLEKKEIELAKEKMKQTRIVKLTRSNSADLTKTNFEKNSSKGNLIDLE